jgi:hypothetical protein
MKLIIAGTRDLLVDVDLIDAVIKFHRLNEVKEIVSGTSGNVDEAGEEWSAIFLEKEPKIFRAEWAKEGVAAGPIRNSKMAEYGDALLLIWDGKSSGSMSMKQEMQKRKKPIYEVILRSY